MKLFKRINLKNKWLLVVATAVLMLIIGYALASLLIWRDYSQSLARSVDSWQSVQQQINGSLISDQQDWQIKYATIKPVLRDLAQKDCQLTPLVAWQAELINRPADDYQQCLDIKAQAEQAAGQLAAIDSYVVDIVAINQVLTPLAGLATKQGEDNWGDTAKEWQLAVDKLQRLQLSDQLSDYQADLAKALTAVSRAWQKLVDSDKAENAQSFESAKQELETTYEDFGKQAKQYPHSEDNIFDI